MGGLGDIRQFGWVLIVIGAVTALMGALLVFEGKTPLFGKLPGDIVIRRESFTFYFPIASMLIISAVISLILFLFRK